DFDPRRPWRRCALHEEERAARAVRVPLHDHRAIHDVRQERVGDVRVVLQQIAFRQLQLRPEDFPEVGEPHLLPVDGKDHVVLIAWNDEAVHLRASGASFGGRFPWSTAPATGTYVSSAPSSAHRSSSPPRLMSPRPTNSIGNRSRSPKTPMRMSTYFGDATLPSSTTSQPAPISAPRARALASSGRR